MFQIISLFNKNWGNVAKTPMKVYHPSANTLSAVTMWNMKGIQGIIKLQTHFRHFNAFKQIQSFYQPAETTTGLRVIHLFVVVLLTVAV